MTEITLEPDRGLIETFVNALFSRAGTEGYVSLRAFIEGNNKKFRFTPAALTSGLAFVIAAAEDDARRAAQFPKSVVFCPPICVFANGNGAREKDVKLGVALSVELDFDAEEALARLEDLIGPATVVVRSGGQWIDNDGVAHDRLHAHWRLAKPAADEKRLAALKQARHLAALITGGDPTNAPICHPIRWPGSWHRKVAPRLCDIVRVETGREIDLDEALEVLTKAMPARSKGNGKDRASNPEPQAEIDRLAAALAVIPNGPETHWDVFNTIGMAMWRGTGGSEAGFAAFDGWASKSSKYDAGTTSDRWEHYFTSPPTKLGAGTVFFYAKQADPAWEVPKQDKAKQKKKPPPPHAERDLDALLTEMNRDNCVVLDGAKTLVLRFETVEHMLNRRRYTYFVPMFLQFGDFRNLYLNRVVVVGDTTLDLGGWWLTHPWRRQYAGVVFEPGSGAVVKNKLNLWRGWGVQPKAGDWGLMREHIFQVLAARDEDVRHYIFNWLAWAVQHPAEQPETAVGFIGKRGVGKSLLGTTMCRIFGNHSLHISSAEQLGGRFNAHLRQCCFLFADEAYGPKDKSAEGNLKRLITEPTLTIEAKRRDPITAPNCLHVMLASNEDWLVPAGEGERRFVVQEAADTYMQDDAWFSPIYKQLYKDGGLEAMLFDLLNYDLGNWHPRKIVSTAALGGQQEESLSALEAWWEELLQTGVLAGFDAPDRAVSNEYEEEIDAGTDGYGGRRTRFVRRPGLYDQAREMSPRLKGVTDAAIGRYLKKRGCVRDWPRRRRGWQFPPLAKCREDWLQRFPQTTWRDTTPDAEWKPAEPD